jgi:putative hydrolase of the HAD superfamily
MVDLRGVVLDLDGLLIDSEWWVWLARNETLVAFDRPQLSLEEGRLLVGVDDAEEWRRLRIMRDLPDDRERYFTVFREAYYRVRDRHFGCMPGVGDLMKVVEKLGLPLALASNGSQPIVTEALSMLGLGSRFSAVASVDEVVLGKPAPDVYLLALQRIGVDPHAAIAIEDSPIGLQAATAAGIRCLVVPNELTATQDFSAAYLRFSSLIDVASWLLANAHGVRSEPAPNAPLV